MERLKPSLEKVLLAIYLKEIQGQPLPVYYDRYTKGLLLREFINENDIIKGRSGSSVFQTKALGKKYLKFYSLIDNATIDSDK